MKDVKKNESDQNTQPSYRQDGMHKQKPKEKEVEKNPRKKNHPETNKKPFMNPSRK